MSFATHSNNQLANSIFSQMLLNKTVTEIIVDLEVASRPTNSGADDFVRVHVPWLSALASSIASKSVESKKKWQKGEYQSMTTLVDTDRQNSICLQKFKSEFNLRPEPVMLITRELEKTFCARCKKHHQNVQNRFLKARDQYVRFRFRPSDEDAF